ncbi:GNAT family N-acetyltransferase [Pseudovibrio exalbescens]|uniref:N-acetyltransferase domain-containing protein n=1 Tax=Pseudovibrio exalbescens TaxID=197461 RepID=A0A1U7JI62_9HYPH|nr:GNAT family N-acetyltransferase [Pseudovibrio exalbescens]OKL44419.1 hypothetical protein A3843_08500 [Pseudovibrio exalbescens]
MSHRDTDPSTACFRPFDPQRDLQWVHALNQANGDKLSFLSTEELLELIASASYARVSDDCMAFLIAFEETDLYDSQNFKWFRHRYASFTYVDRIAVDPRAQGQGVARSLYEDLFSFSKRRHKPFIGCEVNSDPPNPASMAFHRSLGFEQIGSAVISQGQKTVSYLARAL